MMEFWAPYFIFCGSATYSLIQNMESMGWVSFWEGIFIDPSSTFDLFLLLYLVFLPLVSFLSIIAAFSLHRVLGVLFLCSWILPGVLSVIGLDLNIIDVPDSYRVNDGSMYVGETKSTLYNVFTIFLLGWSIFTLFVHVFKIKKKFKDAYDHIWYTLGLAAAVIFVVDSNTSFYKSELAESESNITHALSIASGQLHYAKSICLKKKADLTEIGISESFCPWVDMTESDYFRLAEDKYFTRYFKKISDFEKMITNDRLADITKFNGYICNSESESSNCDRLSFEIDRFSEKSNWPNSYYALAIVPINKALSIYWTQSSERYQKLAPVENVPNTKWFFYMFLGFIAGGKVANSSRALAGEPKPIFRRNAIALYIKLKIYFIFLLKLIEKVFKKTLLIFRSILIPILSSFCYRLLRSIKLRRRQKIKPVKNRTAGIG